MSTFLELHVPGSPLLMPNPWDIGSAKVLASLGFKALATTSSGFAATLGRLDGSVTRDEAVAHAAALADAVDVPVSGDFENCFGDSPDAVAETVLAAATTSIAGCSVEDWSGSETYDRSLAVDRVAAAVASKGDLVITARAEGLLHGEDDLGAVIDRLNAFGAAGADVLFAPGLREVDDVRTVVSSVDKPVSVLAWPRRPGAGSGPGFGGVAELAEAGVARISVGGWFAYVALGALVDAGRTLLGGSFDFTASAAAGRQQAAAAFGR